MSDLSDYSFTGRLTKDAEFKTIASGKTLLELNVAVNVGFGNYKTTNWLRVQWWGDRGKNISEWLVKGSLIAGAGELQLKPWEKDGRSGVDAVVTVNSIQLLQSKQNELSKETTPPVFDDVTF